MWTKDNERHLYQRPKHSPKFHVWGGVSSRGAMPLCVFDCNMTAEVYTDILEGFLLPTAHTLFEDGFVLQQDNDPKHTSRHAKRWFEEKNVDVLQWPSYSPDLNPIENIWALMKDAVNQKNLSNIVEMKREVVQFWDTLTHETLTSLVESMPNRISECIARHGGLTKY